MLVPSKVIHDVGLLDVLSTTRVKLEWSQKVEGTPVVLQDPRKRKTPNMPGSSMNLETEEIEDVDDKDSAL
jgi:hypothetical protein